jgi:hypothetical protein
MMGLPGLKFCGCTVALDKPGLKKHGVIYLDGINLIGYT